MKLQNLKSSYFENSSLIIEIQPFIYEQKNPRLPRKHSKGYNLISDTEIFFSTVLSNLYDYQSNSRFKVKINIFCGNDRLGKADLDNYSKAILDGITKSKKVWIDDKQIDDLHIIRNYTENIFSYITIKIDKLI